MGRIRAKACRAVAQGLGGLLLGGWATGLSLREGMVVGPEGAELRGVSFGRYFCTGVYEFLPWFVGGGLRGYRDGGVAPTGIVIRCNLIGVRSRFI